MRPETEKNLTSGIAKIRRNLDRYEEIAGGSPTYDDEQEMSAALAAIERACYALRIVQSQAMAESKSENVGSPSH